ncbi:hypothetical protein [Streptomyces sp. NPDC000878]
MGAWRFVVAFGTVSLLADFVHEGARSITGPVLAHLGATAAVVGIVTDAGYTPGRDGIAIAAAHPDLPYGLTDKQV